MAGHIAGSRTPTLNIIQASLVDAGTYSVVVTNDYGSTNSEEATLTVDCPPAIVQQPTDQAVPLGDSASFSVGAVGAMPLSYQWLFDNAILADNTNISGSRTATLTIDSIGLVDLGSYSVIVTNAYGAVNRFT